MISSLLLTMLACAADPAPAKAIAAPSEAAMTRAADYSKAENGDTLLVMHDGKVVFEWYEAGASAERRQMLASGSKSFVGVAAAAAVDDGLIRLDDPASEALVAWKNDPLKAKITYRQLLSLTSGLTPAERGAALRSPSWAEIVARPMTGKPGEQFEYGAYQLNAAASAIQARLKDGETFEAYLKRRILEPLGMTVEWRMKCADGHPQVGGGAHVTARDWAKFGEFLRLEGRGPDKQIITRESFAELIKGSKPNPAYGLTLWLKESVSPEQIRGVPTLREWSGVANSKTLPEDLFAAAGAGKQRLYVIPSLQLVVVRQGGLRTQFDDVEFLKLLLADSTIGK